MELVLPATLPSAFFRGVQIFLIQPKWQLGNGRILSTWMMMSTSLLDIKTRHGDRCRHIPVPTGRSLPKSIYDGDPTTDASTQHLSPRWCHRSIFHSINPQWFMFQLATLTEIHCDVVGQEIPASSMSVEKFVRPVHCRRGRKSFPIVRLSLLVDHWMLGMLLLWWFVSHLWISSFGIPSNFPSDQLGWRFYQFYQYNTVKFRASSISRPCCPTSIMCHTTGYCGNSHRTILYSGAGWSNFHITNSSDQLLYLDHDDPWYIHTLVHGHDQRKSRQSQCIAVLQNSYLDTNQCSNRLPSDVRHGGG